MQGTKILIVQKDITTSEAIKNDLHKLGCEVVAVVQTGEEAIEKAGAIEPNLLLIDVDIKGDIDGVDTAAEIRACFNIPVIYLADSLDDNLLERVKLTEPYGYIFKPVNVKTLYATIELARHKYEMDTVRDMVSRKFLRQMRASEQWFATTLRCIGDGVITTDNSGNITFMNSIAAKLTGWQQDDMQCRNLNEVFRVIDEETGKYLETPIGEAIEQGISIGGGRDLLLEVNDKCWIPIDINAAPIRDEYRKIIGSVLIFRDITEQKKAKEEMLLASKVFENTLEGIMITDSDYKVLSVNRAFTEITGYTAPEVIGQKPRILKARRQNEHLYKELWEALLTLGKWEGEIPNTHKNGRAIPMWLSITGVKDKFDKVTHYVVVIRDISERKRYEEQIKHQAYHDVLTALPNRFMLNERLAWELNQAEQNKETLAVAFLDLDGFKNINDTLGHNIGDQLLQAVAQRLMRCVRKGDTVARMGGDEFTLILPKIQQTEKDVELVAQRVLDAVSKVFNIENHRIRITTSIGISIYPQDSDDAEVLMQKADAAMYIAKSSGKNKYRFYPMTNPF